MKWLVGATLALAINSPYLMALDLEEAAKMKDSQSSIETSFSDEIKKMMSELGDVENVRMMPIKNVMLIQLKGKPPMFISSNGRFLIDGEIKDLWNMEPVKTAEQADKTWLLNLDTFGKGKLLNQMAVVPFGNPNIPKQARVFVSPTSKESQEFLINLDPFKVNLDLIIMPHDKGSITPSMKAWCGYSTVDTIQVLMTGNVDDVGQRECTEEDLKKVMTPMLMAMYLDVNKVPYFVRIDGRRYSGVPEKLLEWLENKQQPIDVTNQSPADANVTVSKPTINITEQ